MADLPDGFEFRIGSVPYLNALPLVCGARDRCRLAVPSVLAEEFRNGSYDAALLPAYEALARPGARVVDDIGIGCDGEVFSVFLAHREPVESLTSVALDPASRTSSHLLQVVFAEFYGLHPTFTTCVVEPGQARLLIGDPAIAFRRGLDGNEWNFLDLGEVWKRETGLPFVFAVWVVRPDFERPAALARWLRTLKESGLAQRETIAARQSDPVFALEYLTRWIRYDLGGPHKVALRRYADLLSKHKLVANTYQLTFC